MTALLGRDAEPEVGRPELALARVGRPSLWESRELVLNLTRREVSGQYRRTVLGRLWSFITPLSTMLVYTLVFAVILKQKPDRGDPSGLRNYALALMCGLLPWSFFSAGVTSGMQALLANSNLVLKVYFRRDVLVAAQVLSLVVTFLLELVVLTAAILGFGAMPLPYLPLVVLAVAFLAAFTLGVALLLSVATVYFRDTTHFVAIAFQLMFYLSPIIYPISLVRDELHARHLDTLFTVYQLNPITRFVEVFRSLLYDNALPSWQTSLYCVVLAVAVLLLGGAVFGRFEGRLAEEL